MSADGTQNIPTTPSRSTLATSLNENTLTNICIGCVDNTIFACSNNKSTSGISKDTSSSQTVTFSSKETDEYVPTSKDSLGNILNNVCRTMKYELIDLYKDTDTIPGNDYLTFVSLLKVRGLK